MLVAEKSNRMTAEYSVTCDYENQTTETAAGRSRNGIPVGNK